MKVILAGAGAFGIKHLEAMSRIEGIEVVSLVGRDPKATAEVAKHWKIPHVTTELSESLAQEGVEAALLATPTQMHAAQAIECLRAGKHVMIEIPIADSLADSQRVVEAQRASGGLVAMAGTLAGSIRAISGSTSASRPGRSRCCKWTCRPTFSAVPT